MSRVSRSSSEAEDVWETEDDMIEGDLGYGLGRKPGGIYQVPCSITSKKRPNGKNPSPPSLQRKGEESSETIFQCSRNKGVQDTRADGGRAANHRRLSSAGKTPGLPAPPPRRYDQGPYSPGTGKSITAVDFHLYLLNIFFRLNLFIEGFASTCQAMPHLKEPILTLSRVGPRTRTQVVRLGGSRLYLLSHVTGPHLVPVKEFVEFKGTDFLFQSTAAVMRHRS